MTSNRTGWWIGFTVVLVVLTTLIYTGFVTPGFFAGDTENRVAARGTSTSEPLPPVQPPPVIPTARAPMPHRPAPLANPTTCGYQPHPEQPQDEFPATPPPDGPVPSTGTATATLETSAGTITLTLDRALAPCTVNSFIDLARQGFYNNTSCHRLGTSGLQMLQCGDPLGDGTGGPGYTVKDENFPQLTYGRGILALAKTSEPDSGGSQFFMVYGDSPLPAEYAVFGSVTDDGLRVLDRVARAGIDRAQMTEDGTGRPAIRVRFSNVTIGP